MCCVLSMLTRHSQAVLQVNAAALHRAAFSAAHAPQHVAGTYTLCMCLLLGLPMGPGRQLLAQQPTGTLQRAGGYTHRLHVSLNPDIAELQSVTRHGAALCHRLYFKSLIQHVPRSVPAAGDALRGTCLYKHRFLAVTAAGLRLPLHVLLDSALPVHGFTCV